MNGFRMAHALAHVTDSTPTLHSRISNLLQLNMPLKMRQFTSMETNVEIQPMSLFAAMTAETAICPGLSMTQPSGTLTMPLADASQTSALLKATLTATIKAITPKPAFATETVTAATVGHQMISKDGTQPKPCTGANLLKTSNHSTSSLELAAPTHMICSAVPTATTAVRPGHQTTLRCGTLMT